MSAIVRSLRPGCGCLADCSAAGGKHYNEKAILCDRRLVRICGIYGAVPLGTGRYLINITSMTPAIRGTPWGAGASFESFVMHQHVVVDTVTAESGGMVLSVKEIMAPEDIVAITGLEFVEAAFGRLLGAKPGPQP